MARQFALDSHHCVMDAATSACSECVLECNNAACIGDIDGRCTDQCVIVACDGDIQCSEGSCESTCEDPNNCPLPGHTLAACDTIHHNGVSCAQDKCSLACNSACDDPENCSLANITEHVPPNCSQFTAHQIHPPRSHSADWNATLDAFLCSCGDAFPLRDGLLHNSFPQDPYSGPSPPLSTITSSSDSNALSPFSTPLQPVVYPAPLSISQSTASVVPAKHTCLWNGCRSSFPSLRELISHVNLSHLGVSSSEPPEPISAPSSYLRLSSDAPWLSCQWDNCHEYSPTAVTPSTAFDDALSLLTGHLLHDHLGLQGAPEEHDVAIADAAIADAIVSVPEPDSGHDMKMRGEEQSSDSRSKRQSIPLGESEKRNHEGSPISEDKMPNHVVDGSEKCQWHGCELSFSTIDDLMNHLTAEHVGSGKNHYECFWGDCERSGKNGFTSKQKVCRHLQMHTGHKPFQCKLCKQHFSESATLQQHMRRHTHEKPYVCDVPGCGKAFAIAGALTIHRRTHMGLKPFKCKYCDRAFSESSNLSKHMRTHTGVRPYVCSEPGCGKSFARPDQFSRHQRVHSKRHRGVKLMDNDVVSQEP